MTSRTVAKRTSLRVGTFGDDLVLPACAPAPVLRRACFALFITLCTLAPRHSLRARTHQCYGYDAGFYGYLWSEVFAHEICAKFEQSPGGLLDSEMGRRLRQTILEPCASKSAMDMMTAFLGRKPTADAFCAEHGLDLLNR